MPKPKPPKLTAAESCARARAARPQIPEGMIGKVFFIVTTPEMLDRISGMTPVQRGEFFSDRPLYQPFINSTKVDRNRFLKSSVCESFINFSS